MHEDSARTRLILRLAIGAVWLIGVILAIRSGWVPGLEPPGSVWTYPLGNVVLVIAQITVISLCLYDALRPRSEGSFRSRIARASLVSFLVLAWTVLNSWTDQPGYAYVAGTYVLIVTALLLITLVVLVAVRVARKAAVPGSNASR